uniref:Kinesin-like protein n=1 Tax=Trypanosoma congolense (strain IL3000) TaxID=1068625 RepID=G0V2B1_TRYCI|nr:unnamed protein product [Trypanosoma congolense IL3000]
MENIRVVVRVRPFLPNEKPQQCVTVCGKQVSIGEDRSFAFDKVFDRDAKSDAVCSSVADPLISSFLDGYTVSTIAYGQTGAGKTYTMARLSQYIVERVRDQVRTPSSNQGAASSIASEVSLAEACPCAAGTAPPEFRFSAMEVYNDQISDLSATASSPARARSFQTLPLREDTRYGVFVKGLSEVTVDSAEGLLTLIEKCISSRRTAVTQMNEISSRSHCLLTITLTRNGKMGRFALVDLAGSERMKKSHRRAYYSSSDVCVESTASRIKEGICINSGLLALGNVISALCARKQHVPYRASKLTRLLQPMLSGNTKTTMMPCVSPAAASFEETLNTLKYANRVKSLRTQPLQVAAPSATGSVQRVMFVLGDQLDDVKQKDPQPFLGIPVPPSSGGDCARINMLEEKLRVEENVTLRLKEDLFNAEYTAMIEVEKRKSLEKRIALLEMVVKERSEDRGSSTATDVTVGESTASHRRRSAESSDPSDEGGEFDKGQLIAHLETERECLESVKVQKNTQPQRFAELDFQGQHLTGSDLVSSLPNGDMQCRISGKGQHTQNFQRQGSEAVRALEKPKRGHVKMFSIGCHFGEDLPDAVTKSGPPHLKEQGKQQEQSCSVPLHNGRLRKAEETAEEYRRRAHETAAQLDECRRNDALIQKLQAQIPEMREELDRQVIAVREGHQREQKMVESHAQKVNSMKRQIGECEAHILRLQEELQRKEREIAQVKFRLTNSFDHRRSAACLQRKQLLRALEGDTTMRTASVQKEIDLELRALAMIETDLEDFSMERRELKSRLDSVEKYPNEVKKSSVVVKEHHIYNPKDIARGAAEVEGDRDAVFSEVAGSGGGVTSALAISPFLLQTLRRLEEVEDSIDSLQEARKYHLQRVRRLQTGPSSPLSAARPRACDLLQPSLTSDSLDKTMK